MVDTWGKAWVKTYLTILRAGFLFGAVKEKPDDLIAAGLFTTFIVYNMGHAPRMQFVMKGLIGVMGALAVLHFSIGLSPALQDHFERNRVFAERSGPWMFVAACGFAVLAWASWRETLKYPRPTGRRGAGLSRNRRGRS